MNKEESTTMSSPRKEDFTNSEKRVTDQKMVELLKLVHYERKSIKQASNYLKINYNSAKRIIRNFRLNKLQLTDFPSAKYEQYENLLSEYDSKKQEIMDLMAQKLNGLAQQLTQLDEEVKNNYIMLSRLLYVIHKITSK